MEPPHVRRALGRSLLQAPRPAAAPRDPRWQPGQSHRAGRRPARRRPRRRRIALHPRRSTDPARPDRRSRSSHAGGPRLGHAIRPFPRRPARPPRAVSCNRDLRPTRGEPTERDRPRPHAGRRYRHDRPRLDPHRRSNSPFEVIATATGRRASHRLRRHHHCQRLHRHRDRRRSLARHDLQLPGPSDGAVRAAGAAVAVAVVRVVPGAPGARVIPAVTTAPGARVAELHPPHRSARRHGRHLHHRLRRLRRLHAAERTHVGHDRRPRPPRLPHPRRQRLHRPARAARPRSTTTPTTSASPAPSSGAS